MPPATTAPTALRLLMAFLLHRAASVTFDLPASQSFSCSGNIYCDGAYVDGDGVIQLTRNDVSGNLGDSQGRAVYSRPVHLWDAATRNLTSFSTRFSFFVGNPPRVNNPGDGLAFFLAPNGSSAPNNSGGGMLGLFNVTPPSTAPAAIPTVAVEFDTYGHSWDPYAVHVGIDVNSVVSVVNVTWKGYGAWTNASVVAVVDYNASTNNLSVSFSGDDGTYRALSHLVDLREWLPEWVEIGFSATTGAAVEIHKIMNWSFRSTLEDSTAATPSHPPAPSPSFPLLPPPQGSEKKSRAPAVAGVLAGIGALAVLVGLVWFCIWQRRARGRTGEVEMGTAVIVDGIDDGEFDGGSKGPRRYSYSALAFATSDFAEEGKLGEGGFGSVYRGFLSDPGLEVAVKKISKNSKQGKKEYAAEIKIISRLRHRNLVQLVGWCHDGGDLLLVYEHMPNGSLDAHLYPGRGKPPLSWAVRHRVVLGLASALFYLHWECERCVVHRDVKPSNVLLDAGFNARLGDFGLARLADHDQGLQTTVLAGTMGYLAPECVITGRASKESDVYSFGVLALEIACGRRAIESHQAPGKVGLVEWVWGLYGKGTVLEAADGRLRSDFDAREMEQLMVVGLWCAHPDFAGRPSMRQVLGALNFESPLPELGYAMPVPMYYAPSAPGKETQTFPTTSASTGVSSFTTSGDQTATSCSSLESSKSTVPLLP